MQLKTLFLVFLILLRSFSAAAATEEKEFDCTSLSRLAVQDFGFVKTLQTFAPAQARLHCKTLSQMLDISPECVLYSTHDIW